MVQNETIINVQKKKSCDISEKNLRLEENRKVKSILRERKAGLILTLDNNIQSQKQRKSIVERPLESRILYTTKVSSGSES